MKTHSLAHSLIFSLFIATSVALGQTEIWKETFDPQKPGWTFTPNTFDNQWIVNNVYAGGTYVYMNIWPITIPNVANQPSGITNYPNSNYLHIHNTNELAPAGILNANFLVGFGGASNENATSPNIPTTGYTNIKVSYWWLCRGGANSKGTISYSIDNGTTWTVLASHSDPTNPSPNWVYVSHDLPASVNNQADFKLKINWTDSDGEDPAFAIDDIIVSGTQEEPPPNNGPTITNVSLPPATICEGYGSNTYAVTFTANGTYNSGNIFYIEISDASGAFTSPQQIGAINESTAGTKTQNCIIPNTLAPSTDYKIRVRSTDPALTSDGADFVVHPFPKIKLEQFTLPDCGASNGSIIVSATKGYGNYLFHIVPDPNNAGQIPINSQNTNVTFANLPSNSYKVHVQDPNDPTCIDGTSTINLVVAGAPTVTDTFTNISCHGAGDGSIQATASNGVGAFVHTLTDADGNVLHTFSDASTYSTGIYDDLSAGKYTLTIVDDNNCPYVKEFTIVEPDPIALEITTYDANCGANTGAIAWKVSGGTGKFTAYINGIAQPQTDTIAKQIQPGVYLVEIIDSMGCLVDSSVSINAGSGGTIDSAQVVIIHSGCNGPCSGSIVATSPSAATYTLNTITNTTGEFINLCHGNYNLTVSNGSGCEITQAITVMAVEPPRADFGYSPAHPTTFNAQVTFHNYSTHATKYDWTISDLRTGYSYLINDPYFSHVFVAPDSNMYHVCLTASNEYGCKDIVCKDIAIQDEIMIFIPNTFTPDGNEYNQTWKIIPIGIDNQQFVVQIFNRWGEMIYESHDSSIDWDATYNGQPVSEGMYSWRITVKDPINDYRKTYTGNVNVIR